jgi:hypothetical protein
MRRAARTDRNHAEIRDCLRNMGVRVFDTARIGGGFPDLVACHGGRVYLFEVKMPGCGLTEAEKEFHQVYDGYVSIVYSVEDALIELGLMT